jgi:hypothetical protein
MVLVFLARQARCPESRTSKMTVCGRKNSYLMVDQLTIEVSSTKGSGGSGAAVRRRCACSMLFLYLIRCVSV